jgi:hypothetical protein
LADKKTSNLKKRLITASSDEESGSDEDQPMQKGANNEKTEKAKYLPPQLALNSTALNDSNASIGGRIE